VGKGTWAVALAAFIVATTVSAAVAHRAYAGWEAVWENGDGKCLNEKVSLDHPADDYGGRFWTEADAQRELNPGPAQIDCYQSWERPVDYLRVKVIALKLVSGDWSVCVDTGWKTNNVTTEYMVRYIHANQAPCGAGQYRTQGKAQIRYNGEWIGGPMFIPVADKHYLPCASGDTCE
jgi:hypothetical protein